MLKQAVVVVGSGVAEEESPAIRVSGRIGKGLDNCKLSGVQSGIANAAQRGEELQMPLSREVAGQI